MNNAKALSFLIASVDKHYNDLLLAYRITESSNDFTKVCVYAYEKYGKDALTITIRANDCDDEKMVDRMVRSTIQIAEAFKVLHFSQ